MRRETLFAAAGAAMFAALLPAPCAAQARPDLFAGDNGPGADANPKHLVARHTKGPSFPAGPPATPVADDRAPGSLLLFPEFDNTADGIISLLTVTNTASNGGNVKVEYIYIDETDCSEFNRTETLTPNDTLTLITNVHNPQLERGYVYAFAKNTSGPVVWNALIGQQLIVSGIEAFDYGINAVTFLGIGDASGVPQPNGSPTDLDGDGNWDLDGAEYAQAPEEILVPRFLGQSMASDSVGINSELILIALTGGSAFTTRVDFLIYNDNEEVFSSEYEFECWDKPHLLDITGLFSNNFLANNTNQDPNEIFGQNTLESGWFRVDGAVANSSAEAILDPAFYCVLVERVSFFGVADLPFSVGGQSNGSLLPHNIRGDGDPTPTIGDNQ